jgi:hypothetical protein
MLLLIALLGCTDVENPDGDAEGEVITTVTLSWTDDQGVTTETVWADPEDDGDPVVDDVVLAADQLYTLSVAFGNELAVPAEDVTLEIQDEAHEHQVFFTGADGLVTIDAVDQDSEGLPVGLDNDAQTGAAGQGSLTVTLRHLPDQNGAPQKVEGLADQADQDGIETLPGESDASVTFDVVVE